VPDTLIRSRVPGATGGLTKSTSSTAVEPGWTDPRAGFKTLMGPTPASVANVTATSFATPPPTFWIGRATRRLPDSAKRPGTDVWKWTVSVAASVPLPTRIETQTTASLSSMLEVSRFIANPPPLSQQIILRPNGDDSGQERAEPKATAKRPMARVSHSQTGCRRGLNQARRLRIRPATTPGADKPRGVPMARD